MNYWKFYLNEGISISSRFMWSLNAIQNQIFGSWLFPSVFLWPWSSHIIPLKTQKHCSVKKKNPNLTVTQIHVMLTLLSQPSSKLSQLFINMKLCLSQVEQWFPLATYRHCLAPLQGHCHSFANFSIDTYCSGIHFPPDSLESPDLS